MSQQLQEFKVGDHVVVVAEFEIDYQVVEGWDESKFFTQGLIREVIEDQLVSIDGWRIPLTEHNKNLRKLTKLEKALK